MTELLVCGECGKKLGGKSAHGRNKKHHYYGHPRQLNSDGVTHLQRCRLERVRAERIEDIVLKSLKKLIQTPCLVEHWLEIYAKATHSEIPALEAKVKALDSEIESKSKRVQNLVSRIAELPADIPADIFYHQIKETNQKIQELKQAKQELRSKAIALKGQAIDKDGLVDKIKNTVAKLEETSVESRRPLYTNLIQFAELHPTKIKVGVIAPEKGQYKATGTEGTPGAESDFQNFKGEPGKVIDLVRRGGSTSVTIGAPGRT
ncbi:MAG: recombinase zinc beta ribbon domain-containing protein [Bdellovibrionales bacterium]